MTDLQRFWSYVSKEKGQGARGTCWEWQGARLKGKNGSGNYGQFFARGQHFLAHRWLFQRTSGELPRDVMVCHHCDNPPCVRRSHLFQGTAKDNYDDARRKGRAFTQGLLGRISKEKARRIQSMGGSVKSERKTQTCRENAKKAHAANRAKAYAAGITVSKLMSEIGSRGGKGKRRIV